MSATIKDVAKVAGVSISTVSRVINDSKPVSSEARKKVLDAIEELGYKPNEVARTLVTKRSYLIGIIVTDIGNSYVAEIVRGIEEVGRMYDYDIILCSSYGDKKSELKFINLLTGKQAEGIILVSEEMNKEAIELLKSYKLPFIYLNRYLNIRELPTVSIDSVNASYEMTKYLIEEGHKDIMYVTASKGDNSIEKLKIEGYKKALAESGIEKNIILEAEGSSMEDGYDIGEKVLKSLEKGEMTAIFSGQDEMAIGIMNYLYDKGVKVPEDVSVVGYGDMKISSIYRPKLTTVVEPGYDIGAVSIRRVIKEIEGDKTDEKSIDLPIQIIKRESCEKN